MVGARGFEPPTPWSRTRRFTKTAMKSLRWICLDDEFNCVWVVTGLTTSELIHRKVFNSCTYVLRWLRPRTYDRLAWAGVKTQLGVPFNFEFVAILGPKRHGQRLLDLKFPQFLDGARDGIKGFILKHIHVTMWIVLSC